MDYPNDEIELAHKIWRNNPSLEAYNVREGGIVRLFESDGQPIKMPAKWFFGKSTAVLGISGSGKTQTLKRLIFEMHDSTLVNLTIFDPEGDYSVLKEVIPHLEIIGEDKPLEPLDAERICERAIKKNIPTVISLVETPRSKWIEFVLKYLKKEWDMSNHYRRYGRNMPHMNILEEADTFVPRSIFSTTFKEKQQFVELRDTISKYAKQGRKRGLSIIMATQRIPEVDTTTISQVSTIFFHRVGFDVDVNRFAKMMGLQPSQMKQIADRLKVGQCILSADFNRGVEKIALYRVRMLPVRDVSKTATPDDVEAFNQFIERGEKE